MKVLLLLLCCFLSICAMAQVPCYAETNNMDYTTKLGCDKTFNSLQSLPLKSTFANVKSLKLIYEIESDDVYYINSSKYRFHFDFVSKVLKTYDDATSFNEIEYGSSPKRLYGVANLNYYTNSKIYTLEFFPDDEISIKVLKKMYNIIIATSYFANELKILNQSWNTAALLQGSSLPIINVDELYKGQLFQCLLPGKAIGTLKLIKTADALQQISPTDIVITNYLPNTLPICAATVTSVYQTPLCHINVLAQNRRTPNAVLRNIFSNSDISKLENKLVSIEVTKESLIIKSATAEEIAAMAKRTRQIPEKTLSADISHKRLFKMKELSFKKVNIVGGKAANMGELSKVKLVKKQTLRLPEHVFAIPFYFYQKHIIDHKISDTIVAILSDKDKWKDRTWLKERLNTVQLMIKNAPLDETLIKLVTDEIGADSLHNFRFRSSTNAEDVPGFNGAGLYDSKTGNVTDKNRSIAKAIKAVWASAWNIRAFEERTLFNIDQTNLAMGILGNKAFGAEEANGVAVTKNLYRNDYPAFTVNVQQGENSVVQPDSGVITEQFLILDAGAVKHNDKVAIDYISKSSLTNGNAIMTEAEVKLLYVYLSAIKKHYWKKYGKLWRKHYTKRGYGANSLELFNIMPMKKTYNDFGLDIEFKLEKDTRQLVIKQVRMY